MERSKVVKELGRELKENEGDTDEDSALGLDSGVGE
jgi:hypothetical protein